MHKPQPNDSALTHHQDLSSKHHDDMLSLRNFFVYITTLWSSQGNLSNKKSKKTEEKGQVTKRVTLAEKRDTISQGRTLVFGIKENVSHWPKRDTICETLI